MFFRNNEASTGMIVRAQISEPTRANTTVIAIGRNIFPSMPRRAMIGRYTMVMVITPNATGRATSRQAARTFSKWDDESFRRSRRTRTIFSIMTTEPSTMIPKSMAPRLIRLPLMPAIRMATKAIIMDKGMAAATISPPRKLPSNSSRIINTRSPPSARFFATVTMVFSTSSVRS